LSLAARASRTPFLVALLHHCFRASGGAITASLSAGVLSSGHRNGLPRGESESGDGPLKPCFHPPGRFFRTKQAPPRRCAGRAPGNSARADPRTGGGRPGPVIIHQHCGGPPAHVPSRRTACPHPPRAPGRSRRSARPRGMARGPGLRAEAQVNHKGESRCTRGILDVFPLSTRGLRIEFFGDRSSRFAGSIP
jgi:hypothetical protein